MNEQALIKFEKVALGYEGQPVIEGLDFEIRRGEYLSVLGQNGSGKTTTMKAILGFLSPMSGKILRSEDLLKNSVGYLPQQQPGQSDFPAGVFEVVLSGCQSKRLFMPFYRSGDRALAEKNMELMNISHLRNKSFRDLSGGQKQRVLLARALCAARDLILLDEPTAGLDPSAAEELYELIEDLQKKEGMAVIMISHDPEKALQSATHVLHLGREMLYSGPVAGYDRSSVLELEKKGGSLWRS
jgi:zinc transport system ATP-binding protein